MTDRIDHGTHQIPGAGTWEIVDHTDCQAGGTLQALSRRDAAPRCPRCGADVTWQLSHLSPTVAADHRGAGRLP